jgi:hypothetical protein
MGHTTSPIRLFSSCSGNAEAKDVGMTEIKPPIHLLSVTSASGSDTVTIHADKEGLLAFRAWLDGLLAKLDRDDLDHEHLRLAE